MKRENAAASRAAAAEATAQLEALRRDLAALQRALRDRDEELAALRGVADEGARARAAREARLEAQLEEARRVLLILCWQFSRGSLPLTYGCPWFSNWMGGCGAQLCLLESLACACTHYDVQIQTTLLSRWTHQACNAAVLQLHHAHTL